MSEKPMMVAWTKLRAAVLDEQGDVLPPTRATIEAWDTQIRAIRASGHPASLGHAPDPGSAPPEG